LYLSISFPNFVIQQAIGSEHLWRGYSSAIILFIKINKSVKSFFKKVFYLYYDGFRGMGVGRQLWLIIFLKLFIMFAILKLFFFSDFLGSKFKSDEEKSAYVIEQLTKQP